ncbi:oxidoreductase [Corynebacterium liangguodongii]|uniref:oxidoreductase n=1 Tax=Corynebacterium liangguodongii TaxID=2079535 RepID=UPI0011B24273|nr:oxidoreductase [Corynebacterium liangguodongii]
MTSALAASAALALAGCSAPAQDPLAEVPAFAVDAPTVTLLSPGTDPQPVEYSAAPEWESTVAVSHGIEQRLAPAAEVDAAAPSAQAPDRVVVPLTATAGPAPKPGKGEDEAARRVDITVGAGGDAGSAEGFALAWRGSVQGAIDTVKVYAPEGSAEADRERVESALLALVSAAVVFPDQPVGVGGSWTVTNRVTGDSSLVSTTTYTLTRREGETVGLDVEVEQRPAASTLRIDNGDSGALDGQSLFVEGASTTSRGSIEVDLGRALPTRGQVSSTTRVVYAGPSGDLRVVQDISRGIEYGA